MNLSSMKRVAIIGAGISGLSCARELQKAGFLVSLFDKSKGVGGRMSHRYYENWEADHGAQYFTAREALFQAQVDDWQKQGVVHSWKGKIVTLSNGQMHTKSSDSIRYVGTPAMTSPAKALASNLNLHTQHTVTDIHQVNRLWKITTKEHGKLEAEFDYLILAIPSVQAQKIVGKYSSVFNEVCHEVQMLPCWTLLAYFKNSLDLPYDGAFVENNLFSWIARDSSKPNRPVYETWVAQAANDWSFEHVDFTQFEIEPVLIKAFADLTGHKPDLYQSHLWRYAKLAKPSEREFVYDPAIQVGLCGDWLKTSTVEGAWTSGYRLAQYLKQLS